MLHGPCERRDENGALSWRGNHRDGKRDGPWTFWHPNGQPSAEGSYRGGEREGEWTFRDPQGAVLPDSSGLYAGDERVGD